MIVISGPVCSGKSKLASNIEDNFNAKILRTVEIIQKVGSIKRHDRLALQAEGERLDRETNGRWVLDELSNIVRDSKEDATFVVDSVRIAQQIEHIRAAYRPVTHIHLTAPLEELQKRYKKKYKRKSGVPTYEKIRENTTEKNIESLSSIADVVINTNRCEERDILVRAASRMSLYGVNCTGYVDIIVGGQFGSEGKGQITAYLANEYDLLVRVGGPNAGHTVFEEPERYIHHHLPSGTRRGNVPLLLSPGMVINVETLLTEISECRVEYNRLNIDPNVMVINSNDIKSEADLVKKIGSTGQGVGHATARRILERGDSDLILAKDVLELKPYIRPASEVLSKILMGNGRVLIEGTQGTGLSLYHGLYPYVTSRDTSVSGCLSEVGVSPKYVRRIIMVCRTYPIRVESPLKGSSGPMGIETSWEEINKRSGIPLSEIQQNEITSTTKRKRRVSEFNWYFLRLAAFLNGATDIALTFTDYLSVNNIKAIRFDQLTQDTINFIEEIEQVTKARVSLIGTGFDYRSIIDRRKW